MNSYDNLIARRKAEAEAELARPDLPAKDRRYFERALREYRREEKAAADPYTEEGLLDGPTEQEAYSGEDC